MKAGLEILNAPESRFCRAHNELVTYTNEGQVLVKKRRGRPKKPYHEDVKHRMRVQLQRVVATEGTAFSACRNIFKKKQSS